MSQVILVDLQDNNIGVAEKLAAHEQGLLHRAFSVFVLRKNEHGQIETLLQQREKTKYHGGGLWSNTCCSHPEPDESVIAAGERRLQEELGFTVSLQEIGVFIYRAHFPNGLIEHEVDHVLIGQFNEHLLIVPNKIEVMDHRWVTLESAQLEFVKDPTQFTPWFAKALEIIKRYCS